MCWGGEEGGKKRVNRRIFQLKEGEEVQPHNEDCSERLAYMLTSPGVRLLVILMISFENLLLSWSLVY